MVARGETPRLAVFMPPGSTKSTCASMLFPPWLLASLTVALGLVRQEGRYAFRRGRLRQDLTSRQQSDRKCRRCALRHQIEASS
jgi:hypothetical protein